jgi:DNA-directed RNA polymerase subunit E'/Rpb7
MLEISGISLVNMDCTPPLSSPSVTIVVLQTTSLINVRNLAMKNDARRLVMNEKHVVEVEAVVAVQVVAVKLDEEEIEPHGVMMTRRREPMVAL